MLVDGLTMYNVESVSLFFEQIKRVLGFTSYIKLVQILFNFLLLILNLYGDGLLVLLSFLLLNLLRIFCNANSWNICELYNISYSKVQDTTKSQSDQTFDFLLIRSSISHIQTCSFRIQRIRRIRIQQQLRQEDSENIDQVVHGTPCLIDYIQAYTSRARFNHTISICRTTTSAYVSSTFG
jgi:hypothetical protein